MNRLHIQDELRLFAFAEEPVKPFFFSVKIPAHTMPVLIPAGVYNIRPGFFQSVIKLIIAFDWNHLVIACVSHPDRDR